MTKTTISLIVNGTKVYARKTTGRPYTHAIVARFADNTYRISNCSSKGAEALHREIANRRAHKWILPEGAIRSECLYAVEQIVLPIIDNTVTLNA
jgi:hypothetical protein